MSTAAIRWALYDAPIGRMKLGDFVVLTGAADHADGDGNLNGLRPHVLAKRLDMEPADVAESLRRLQAAGLVRLDGERIAGLSLDRKRNAA